MTGWRWVVVAWSIGAVLLTAPLGGSVLSFLVVWVVGLVVIGGVRMAVQR